jgi:hypothetical protein
VAGEVAQGLADLGLLQEDENSSTTKNQGPPVAATASTQSSSTTDAAIVVRRSVSAKKRRRSAMAPGRSTSIHRAWPLSRRSQRVLSPAPISTTVPLGWSPSQRDTQWSWMRVRHTVPMRLGLPSKRAKS